MRLSVIIVNYQVCYFLEQCLYTVLQALDGMDAELIVVDNASADESRKLLPAKFPGVSFIWNEMNRGFGAANNQAMQEAKGDYFVLLNPDTLVPQNIFLACIDFYKQHPGAGAVGMRMFSGTGEYLPESKRGLPSAMTAFFKLSGLTALFPQHPRFARYYLGHLSPKELQKVDILAGAFMCFPKQVYESVGGFDERFFMYGEDIDLSYRISKAGFTNYYLPAPGLIHFKGESTVKDAENRRHFYDAMVLFVEKYYPAKSGTWRRLLRAGIWCRSLLNPGAENSGKRNVRNKIDSTELNIVGDPNCVQELQALFPNNPSKSPQAITIYALGKEFGIREVLESWGRGPVPERMRFYAKGSSAIIGSDDKNSQGEVLLLKNQPLIHAIDDNAG